MRRLGFLAVSVLFVGAMAFGSDWPQYRGPNHDGRSDEKITKEWSAGGPPVVWKASMGLGFSSVAVAGGRAYCNGEKDGKECCFALDAETGKQLWMTPIGGSIKDRQGADGPRSTPAVNGDRVYLYGIYQELVCLDAATGKDIWKHDLRKENNWNITEIGISKWGGAASVVVEGDLLFVEGGGPGKGMMSFDKTSGKLAWAHGDDLMTHSTPTVATIHDVRQIIFLTRKGLVGCEPKTGKELWRYEWDKVGGNIASEAMSPVVGGDIVYCSASYKQGSGACQVTRKVDGTFAAKELWRVRGDTMENHWTTPVYQDGYLYGLYKKPFQLRCIDIKTGKEMWVKGGFTWQGGTTLVDGCVLVQDDGGDLVLVEATPKGFHELSRCKPLKGQCWTMATIANGKIYARSTNEGGKGAAGASGAIVCLDVAVK